MTKNLPAATSRQAIAARDRSSRGKVTGRLKAAIERIVWHGDKRAIAASTAGLTDHSLRAAMKKPHVMAYYNNELGLLRESERARNIHALTAVRDDSTNDMARVRSVQALEQLSDEGVGARIGQQRSPGVVIIIQSGPTREQVQVDETPILIDSQAAEQIGTNYGTKAQSSRLAPDGMAPARKQRFLDYDK